MNTEYEKAEKCSFSNILNLTPEFAKDRLLDLVKDKVEWVQDVLERGATRSGFKLRKSGKWHVYQRAVDSEDGSIYEWMMNDGIKHGLYRRFFAKGCLQTGQYKNGEPVGEWFIYLKDGTVYERKEYPDNTEG